jgi:hypothetical protein
MSDLGHLLMGEDGKAWDVPAVPYIGAGGTVL